MAIQVFLRYSDIKDGLMFCFVVFNTISDCNILGDSFYSNVMETKRLKPKVKKLSDSF